MRRWKRLLTMGIAAVLVAMASGAVPTHAQGTNDLGNRVWDDLDADGIQDPGEPGLPGVTVQLFKIGTPGPYRPQQISGPNGEFLFHDLGYGYYKLRFLIPAGLGGYTFSPSLQGPDRTKDSDAIPDPSSGNPPQVAEVTGIFLNASDDLDRDAGLNDGSGPSGCNSSFVGLTLGDTLWRDRNANGLRDRFEPGIAGATVSLWEEGPGYGTFTGRTTKTNENGHYRFDCLEDGRYYITIDGLDDFTRTQPYRSPDSDVDNDQNVYEPTTPHPSGHKFRTWPITLSAGDEPPPGHINLTLDGGFTCAQGNLEVMFVIDKSGSMDGPGMRDATQMVRDFTGAMDPATQRVGAVAFEDDDPALKLSDLTFDHAAVVGAVGGLTDQGGTEAKHGIALGRDLLLAQRRPGAAMVMIVITDAGDADEPGALAEAAMAKGQGIQIITMSTKELTSSSKIDYMRELASQADFFLNQPLLGPPGQIEALYERLRSYGCDDPGGDALVCSDSAVVFDLDISTGMPSADGGSWKVTPDGGAAAVVNPLPDPWGSLPGAQWISRWMSGLGSGTTTYVFERSFELPEQADKTLVAFDAFSDDRISRIEINGGSYSGWTGGNGLAGIPLHFSQLGWAAGWVRPGETNTLRVTVEDQLGYTGLDLEGRVSSCANVSETPALPEPLPFDIQLTFFIPFDHVEDPTNSQRAFGCNQTSSPCYGLCPLKIGVCDATQYLFGADVDGSHTPFGRDADPHGTSRFRVRHKVTALPQRLFDADGVVDGSEQRLVSQTNQYEMSSSLSGSPGDPDRVLTTLAKNDTVPNDYYLKHDWATASNAGIEPVSSRWISDTELELRFEAAVADPLVPQVPLMVDVNWDFKVVLDVTDPNNIVYRVTGAHDGFPAYDLFINGEEVHYHAPDGFDLWDVRWPNDDVKVNRVCINGSCTDGGTP